MGASISTHERIRRRYVHATRQCGRGGGTEGESLPRRPLEVGTEEKWRSIGSCVAEEIACRTSRIREEYRRIAIPKIQGGQEEKKRARSMFSVANLSRQQPT